MSGTYYCTATGCGERFKAYTLYALHVGAGHSDTAVGRLYLSGPMTGLPNFNYEAFDAAQKQLTADGYEVANPANHFDREQGLPREDYIRADVAELVDKAVTAIYLLPGWQNSRGARLEYDIACQLGLTVMYHPDADEEVPVENQAQQLVRNGERQAVYGPPVKDFTRTAKIWSGILGIDVSTQDVALCMVGLKMSRLVATPSHKDSVVDMVGYSICYDRLGEDG